MMIKNMKYLIERAKYTIKSTVPIIGVVRSICRKMNLRFLGYIASGSFGDTYRVIDDDNETRVLKITTDREEAKLVSKLKGKFLPGLVKYYDIKRIKSEKLKRFENYVILMERVTPIRSKKVKDEIEEVIDQIVDDERFIIPGAIDKIEQNDITKKLKIIFDSLNKIGVKEEIVDLHAGNLGLNSNNDLVLFDISVVDFSFINDTLDI